TDQMLQEAFDPDDQPLLEAISAKLEGRTQRQKNPHPKGTLAYAAWVIARLGAWDGYYGKPGPKIMRLGLQHFHLIKYGQQLRPKNAGIGQPASAGERTQEPQAYAPGACRSSRTRPSCATDATSVPSLAKIIPREKPRAP